MIILNNTVVIMNKTESHYLRNKQLKVSKMNREIAEIIKSAFDLYGFFAF